ncbi:hypothetical protein AB0H43_03110 [Hamadaea sp. NPDC050747]|uniref:hypothetical protein n=1 Tax=Hamadaea sp. NPDC050747 TaxID=3155789 RepID=UPI003403B29E
MSHRKRAYVGPNAPMYRAASYAEDDGHLVRTTGPYSTQGAATRSRGRIAGRNVVVRVETCSPEWSAVPGTEVGAA